ncbi:hydroxypyruvate isomerase family protein [Cytobacillus sp. Hz8]|uniref:hydroxypyruvate isomerase family protein n=1 Tax=Cytobacillus sp. Hz8 TaxID=3347168 RepID=UPI0035DEB473
MNQFAVNISTIFTEFPFIERFQKAREAGFSLVECQFPYAYPLNQIRSALKENNLTLVLINLPPGDWEEGERGIAIDPNKVELFRESVLTGIEFAKTLHVSRLHCMAGIFLNKFEKKVARSTYIENLKFAAQKCNEFELTLLIEPINQEDMPNYYLSDLQDAADIIEEVGEPNLKLQFDFYHIQKTKGNLLSNFEKYFEKIGHVQIADVPGRHEPDTGEIHYKRVLEYLEEQKYEGYIGLEYTPKSSSLESFEWLKIYK